MSDVKLNLREMHGAVYLLELLIIEPPLPASAVIRHFIHSDHVARVREWIEHVTGLETEVERLRSERDEAMAGCGALELVHKIQQERRRAKKLETDVDRLMTQLWKMTNLANEEGLKVHALETEIERLTKERDEVTEELADWRDTVRGAMNPCDDEQHCSCCPALRAEVERLTESLATQREVLQEIAEGDREACPYPDAARAALAETEKQ